MFGVWGTGGGGGECVYVCVCVGGGCCGIVGENGGWRVTGVIVISVSA